MYCQKGSCVIVGGKIKSEIVTDNVKTEHQANVNTKIALKKVLNEETVFESESIEIKREVKIENLIEI